MSNRVLGRCPTCKRGLDDVTRAAMGLRNGELLNSLCPGRIGPSDIDHVLHNGLVDPERVMFLEYKDRAQAGVGQGWMLRALTGDWDGADGRRLAIRHIVLEEHPADPLGVLGPVVDWLWEERRAA